MQVKKIVMPIFTAWFAVLCIFITLTQSQAQTQAQTTSSAMPTVILVRHAEKADGNATDPVLSAAGIMRAQALIAALKDAGVSAIITTSLQRTILTAQPLAKARGNTPQVIAIERGGLDQHVQAVVAAIRKFGAGDVVLVVGHSNTVPAIAEALGAPTMPVICESDYANLLVLTADVAGGVRLIRAKYGQWSGVATNQDCK